MIIVIITINPYKYLSLSDAFRSDYILFSLFLFLNSPEYVVCQ